MAISSLTLVETGWPVLQFRIEMFAGLTATIR
jgi:hypothetical protein